MYKIYPVSVSALTLPSINQPCKARTTLYIFPEIEIKKNFSLHREFAATINPIKVAFWY